MNKCTKTGLSLGLSTGLLAGCAIDRGLEQDFTACAPEFETDIATDHQQVADIVVELRELQIPESYKKDSRDQEPLYVIEDFTSEGHNNGHWADVTDEPGEIACFKGEGLVFTISGLAVQSALSTKS